MNELHRGCKDIATRYGSGYTEGFYQRMLQAHMYAQNIPCLSEVDCFVLTPSRTPVLVGRLDLEINHDTILELKVAPAIMPHHLLQLRKYVRARVEMGMDVKNAAVVCFGNDDKIMIQTIDPKTS